MRKAALLAIALSCLTCHTGGASSFTRASVIEQLRSTYPAASLPVDALPAGVTAIENVPYVRRGDRNLLLDVYRPAGEGVHPAVVVVHGGGWRIGDRTMERPFAKRLAGLGYVAAPVTYRLGPEGRFPNAIHDVKAAVRWLRANADRYGIDGAHIGAVGGSAGGQLVALLGATNGMTAFDGTDAAATTELGTGAAVATAPAASSPTAPAPSSDVQAVVDIDGLADFTGPALVDKETKNPGASTSFLGGSFAERPEVWRTASAVTHVGPKSAPTLFIDSNAPSPILPGRPEMCAKLHALHIECTIIDMPGKTPHPFWLVNPWFEPTLERTDAFLRRYLAGGASAHDSDATDGGAALH